MNITLFTRPKSVLTVGLALLLAFDPNLIFQWTGLVPCTSAPAWDSSGAPCKSPGMAPYAKAFPDPSDLHFFDITGFQPLRTFCPARRHRRTGQTHPQHNKNLL